MKEFASSDVLVLGHVIVEDDGDRLYTPHVHDRYHSYLTSRVGSGERKISYIHKLTRDL